MSLGSNQADTYTTVPVVVSVRRGIKSVPEGSANEI